MKLQEAIVYFTLLTFDFVLNWEKYAVHIGNDKYETQVNGLWVMGKCKENRKGPHLSHFLFP